MRQQEFRSWCRYIVVAAIGTALAAKLSWYGTDADKIVLARWQATEADSYPSGTFTNAVTGPAEIVVDYPADGSIFPPEITAPTFLWRDGADKALLWKINVTFSDGSADIRTVSKGERLQLGEIDPRCVSQSNELPKLTPEQAAEHTWTPDGNTWNTIKLHSKGRPATVTISGFKESRPIYPVSTGHIHLSTSLDPVEAPIFYRDVPLIPSKSQSGVVNPLAQSNLPLLAWRLRDISVPKSRLLLTGLHTCANCHSFSADGKTFGMDVDGPANDKGLYAVVPVQKNISIKNTDLIRWNTDKSVGQVRVGFMSQVSPDGRYVLSTFAGPSLRLPDSYYVTNFMDYRFLQVFYPTRGILEWYNRATGLRFPLPGADDPRYVQTDGVWSPDGKYIVFARAEARDPRPAGQLPVSRANDPQETQIQYDLYRIPFNEGKGGVPERIDGASANGMSNNFPKVSPDGRWIVYVQCRNGQLMRPDSQLYIVPFAGGVARRMRANTQLMNSWHSFSPNGHWMVFSSKARSPYTQMYLTHIDAKGEDSPAILIDNAAAANRAVNIPEFVNINSDGIVKIVIPAAEPRRLLDLAIDFTAEGRVEESISAWKKLIELDPDNATAHANLGIALQWRGDSAEGARHLRKAREIDPNIAENESDLNIAFFNREQFNAAKTKADCSGIVSYGNKILAAVPVDAEVGKAVASCTQKRPRR